MKKYLYTLAIVCGAAFMTGCAADEAPSPGSDSKAAVTIYQYAPAAGYDADNDVRLRFVANDKTADCYYYVESVAAKDSYIKANGEAAYADYVISKGTKLTFENSCVEDTATGILGESAITAVAVAKNGSKQQSVSYFTGLTWTTLADGKIFYSARLQYYGLKGASANASLQICDQNEYLYRIKDMYGVDHHLKLDAMKDYIQSPDKDGDTYIFCRAQSQATGIVFGANGPVSARDIGYWQNNSGFITEGGYENAVCTDGPGKYYVYMQLQYYLANSGGNMGYALDEFVPNNLL